MTGKGRLRDKMEDCMYWFDEIGTRTDERTAMRENERRVCPKCETDGCKVCEKGPWPAVGRLFICERHERPFQPHLSIRHVSQH